MHKNASDLLDNAPDARDCAYAGAFKLGHLQLTVEHAAYKGSVLVHPEGCPLQLQLLHDTYRRIQIQYHPSGTDAPSLHQHQAQYLTQVANVSKKIADPTT